MGTITKTIIDTQNKALSETTLTASDTLAYDATTNQIVTLRNPTAGAITPTIKGSLAGTVAFDGYGSVDLSAGLSLGSIAAGAHKVISLNKLDLWLKGNVTVTGGTGLVATFMSV